MADKPKKTLKFQMMMSPEEAEVLDNWMFENRIRSRAEAIRRLCQIALLVQKDLNPIVHRLAKATGLMGLVEEKWDRIITEEKDLNTYAKMVAMLFAETFPPMQREAYDGHNRLADLGLKVNAMLEARDVPEGMQKLRQVQIDIEERLRDWERDEPEETFFLSKDKRKFSRIEDADEALAFARELLDAWLPPPKPANNLSKK
ncbi:hypothetical protein [Mesorhizobium marinum]|uniref:Uncharacterized protein n=1 Tax=Mesorhizobium marinum TaxID=3228790 RepID=A0ABV3R5H2_9HYPH